MGIQLLPVQMALRPARPPATRAPGRAEERAQAERQATARQVALEEPALAAAELLAATAEVEALAVVLDLA